MERRKIRIGTRGSALALYQANYVQAALLGPSEIVIVRTTGDQRQDVPLDQAGGVGLFTKEIERALLDGRIDLAVHSLKDLPVELPAGLALGAVPLRAAVSDVLLVRPDALDSSQEFPVKAGSRVGTSATRRRALLAQARPDLETVALRGNVPTRVDKLRDGQYEAILLAHAGLSRLALELDDLAVIDLPPDRFVPAPAQGMLAIQCRDEAPWRDFLGRLHTDEAARPVAAERRLLAALEGGCQLPFGVNVAPEGDAYRLVAFWRDPAGDRPALRLDLRGDDPEVLADEALAAIHEAADGA